MLLSAKVELENEIHDYNVVGAYLSPTADFKLERKLASHKHKLVIPSKQRVECIRLMTRGTPTDKRDNPWIMVDMWSSTHGASASDSKEHIQKVLEKCSDFIIIQRTD
jgi:hypothetical protein